MPNLPKRPCSKAGCTKIATAGGRCADHKIEHNWGSNKSRRPGKSGWDWERICKRIMKRDGFLCQPCKRHGRTTKAEQVDHKTPRSAGGSDKDSNLEAICIPCHKYKTQQEALDGRKSGV